MTAASSTSRQAVVVVPPQPDLNRELDASLGRWRSEVLDLSHAIHADPELGGQEFRAVKRVRSLLRKAGFSFDERQPSQPTAFSASFGSGDLVVALCVEYDALPGIGHACGHNVNAASTVGAALALAAVAGRAGLTVKVLGTPAEETTGGKVDLLEEGFFDGVSLAMMAHAAAEDVVGSTSLAMAMWDVVFEGQAAHAAAAPWEGVNALDALLVAQTAIAAARQQLPPASIVSLIVNNGGSAVNVIPERTGASVEMRAPSIENLHVIQEKVRGCLEAGALASGCTLQVTPHGNAYAELRQDAFLSEAYREAMGKRGRRVSFSSEPMASTDMGNVSQVVPSIHPMVGYDVRGAVHHTAAFAAFGASAGADRAVLDAAYGLAAAACSAAVDPGQRERLVRGNRQ